MPVTLADYLAERDEPCPSCAYSLRGCTADACPECGQQLILSVRLAEPRLGTWLAGLILVTGAAGFYAFAGALMLINWIAWGAGSGAELDEVAVIGLTLIVLVGSVAFWIVRGRWMRRQSAPVRWACAGLAAVLCAGALAIAMFWPE